MTTAIILAGGLGTRLRETVPDFPKPMVPIRGRPFLEHQMDYWCKQGIDRFILSVGYRYQVIMDHFRSCYRGIPIDYVIEKIPLGTGGGLLLAVQGLNEPLLVLNGDTFFEVELNALRSFHNERKSEWTFSLFRTHEVGRYMGMDVALDGRILSLESNTAQPESLANGGAYLINPSVLSRFNLSLESKISLEDDLLPGLAKSGERLYGIEHQGCFIDIGVPEDYRRAADVLPK